MAEIKNGTRVDVLGWDPSKKLIFIPNGGEGNVTVDRQDSPDKHTVVSTVGTFVGAKTITVDPKCTTRTCFNPSAVRLQRRPLTRPRVPSLLRDLS